MEWNFSDHRGQQAEWFRQKKHNDQNAEWTVAKYAFYRSGDDSNLHSNATSSLPLTNHWFQTLPFLERNNPPPVGFMGDSNAIDPSRGRIEAPKTPPSFRSASFRQRCMASEPISPPNPLRLANVSQDLPRPDTSPRFLRCIFPRFDYESVGDPDFLVFKVKLPDYLIHGPLDALIVAADQYASRLPSGWKTNLFSLTKCDIACHDIPGISELVDPIMAFITKTMTLLYGCPGLTMGQNQPHIVKYAGDIGHTGVQLHCDRCDITANLSLSRKSSYSGGGTYFAAMDKLVKLEQGEILMHPGHLIHAGNSITAGTRFLLVAFADCMKMS